MKPFSRSFGLHYLQTLASFLSSAEFRRSLSSSTEMRELLSKDLLRDPSMFEVFSNVKRSHNLTVFQHKRTQRDGLHRVELPPIKVNNDDDSIIQLIKSCGKKKDISTMRRIHADNGWITDNILIANTFIRSYAKCGALKEARELFDQIAKRDVVSWSALIAGYIEQGYGAEALRCFREMECDGVTPDSVAYASILKACAIVGDLETVKEIHNQVREQGLLNLGVPLGTALVNAYAKCGTLKEAQEVFDHLTQRNVVLWSTLITAYVEQGLGQEAVICFKEMQNDGVTPDSVAYASSLKACSFVADIETVKEIHAQVGDQGLLKKDLILGNSLVNAYLKCGAMKEAQEVFDQLLERNVVSWSALITGYAEQGFGEDALTCFRDMQNEGVIPDSVAFASSLRACAIVGDMKFVKEIHARIREQGLPKMSITLENSLVSAYAKCGAMMEARGVFDQLAERDVVSWTALITGYAEKGFGQEALTCFREMGSDRVTPNSMTYASTLKACAIVGALESVKKIHAQVGEQGLLKNDVTLCNSLVNAYAKCSAMNEAREIFEQLAEPDVVSWNALLAGYAQLGVVNELLYSFNRMMAVCMFPEPVTLLVLLSGCGHGTVLEEGKRLFCMIGTCDHSVSADHHTCMVDLFGRAGHFDQAKSFVIDNTPTLVAFLGACQKSSNVDFGKWTFGKLLQLENRHCSTYGPL